MTTLCISVITVFVAAAVLYLGGWEWIGAKINLLFPKKPLKSGDKVAVYLNGEYNRTATITRVVADGLYIYDKVRLPIGFRGRFYGMGVDTSDGSRFVYLACRKHFRLVRLAEYVRKIFRVSDDDVNLLPDDTDKAKAEGDEDEV